MMRVPDLPVPMDVIEKPPKRRGIPKWLLPVAGYAASGAALVWVLSRFPYEQLGEHLRTMNWWWVAAALVLDIAVYFADAWRWAEILKPAGAPPFRTCLQSVFVGQFASDVLPARAGELVRCFLLSYETEVPLALALTSDVVLRIMDGVWIVIVYLLVTFSAGSHVIVNRVMWGFSAGVAIISAAILFVLFRKHHAHKFVSNTSWAARFVHLLDEIHRLGNPGALRRAMLWSGVYWLFQVLALWSLAQADEFDLSVAAVGFVLIVKALATLIPNAPANVGAYQAAIMYGLGLLLVEKPVAQIFSQIAFWVLTLPTAICGAIAVALTGVNITELHKHASAAHTRHRTESGNP